MPDRGFRDKWAELSFEKKMSIFVGPVVVVVVSAVLTAALSSWGDGDDAQPSPPTGLGDERIEVLDFVVDGGQRQVLVSDPPPVFPQLDVTLRNVGASVSVITGAEFEILDFGRLRICEAGGGPLESSKDYDVVLPVDPTADQVLRSKVSQALEPNSADRFSFTMNVEPRGQGEGVFLYRLDVRLVHDARDQPTRAGTAIVAVPHLPEALYFPADAEPMVSPAAAPDAPVDGVERCYRENLATYLRMIGLSGTRDPRMDESLTTAR